VLLGVDPDFTAAASAVTYVDMDGDEIHIRKDEDLMEARIVMGEKNRKILDLSVKMATLTKKDAHKNRKEERKQKKRQGKSSADTFGIDMNFGGNFPFVMLDVFDDKWQTVYKEMLANPQFAGLLRKFASILDDANTHKSDVQTMMKQLWDSNEVQDMLQWLKTKAPELAPLMAWLENCFVATFQTEDDATTSSSTSSSSTTKGVMPCHKTKHKHHGVECDGCGQTPLIGRRFKKIGHNYDLCEDDFEKLSVSEKSKYKEINANHPRYQKIVREQAQNSSQGKVEDPPVGLAVHTHVSCDGCGMSPIRGIRYTKKGHNYDLCEMDFGKLSSTEQQMYVAHKKPQLIHPNVSCDGCGQAPLIGRRYKMVGRNYDLCENDFEKLTSMEKSKYVVMKSTPAPGDLCQRRRQCKKGMVRTATCPPGKGVMPCHKTSQKSRAKDDTCVATSNDDFEKQMQKAIAESLALSEKALAEKEKLQKDQLSVSVDLSAVESLRLKEAEFKSIREKEFLAADLAAVAAIEEATKASLALNDKKVVDFADKLLEIDDMILAGAVTMSESLVADLAAVALVEETTSMQHPGLPNAVAMSESLVADLAAVALVEKTKKAATTQEKITTPETIVTTDPQTVVGSESGNLSRYVQSYVPSGSVPTSFTQAQTSHLQASQRALADETADEKTDVRLETSMDESLIETSLKMSTIGSDSTPIAAPSPKARFVCDVSCPDKSAVLARSSVQKTWRFRNDGVAKWPTGTSIVHVSGDFVEASQMLADLPDAGSEVDVTMTLTAPSLAGRYVGYFRLAAPDSKRFGHRVWVDVMVINEDAVERSDSVNSQSVDSFTIVDTPLAEGEQEESGAILSELSANNAPVDITDEFENYEDDFENDEESPRATGCNRNVVMGVLVNPPSLTNPESMMSQSLVADLAAVALEENSTATSVAESLPTVSVEDLPIEAGELPSDENTTDSSAYREETQMLCSMGFYDLEVVRAALEASNGNVQAALDRLLQ